MRNSYSQYLKQINGVKRRIRQCCIWGTAMLLLVCTRGLDLGTHAAEQPKKSKPVRRVNPSVLALTELKATAVLAKIPAVDIVDINGIPHIAVLETIDKIPPKQALPNEPRHRAGVRYVEVDEKKLEGQRFASTIFPQRMVVIEGSFPYKAQLEEIRKSLRLEKIADVANTPDAIPVFHGVIMQRRVTSRDGKIFSDWAEFDYRESYRPVHARRLSVMDEDPKLATVMLHPNHELVVPLPYLMKGAYPDAMADLPSIKAAIEKWERKSSPNEPAKNADPKAIPNIITPDHILVRLVDCDVEPGFVYQYRVQCRMQNPNWVGPKSKDGKPEKSRYKDLVSNPGDAEIEILPPEKLDADQIKGSRSAMTPTETRWDTKIWDRALVAKAVFPQESFVYAIEPNGGAGLKPGQGLLQIQRRVPSVKLDGYDEPVGDWLITDVVVSRGQWVGGKQLVKLPLWACSSTASFSARHSN